MPDSLSMVLVVSVSNAEDFSFDSLTGHVRDKAHRSRIVIAVDGEGRAKILKNNYNKMAVQFVSEWDG